MLTVLILRGLPASGKTTWARQRVALAPDRWVRLSDDDLRTMFHGGRLGTRAQEDVVTAVLIASLRAALAQRRNVIVDAPNLDPEHVTALRRIAVDESALVAIMSQFLLVPVEECIRRDDRRPPDRRVGARAIRQMAQQHRLLLAGAA